MVCQGRLCLLGCTPEGELHGPSQPGEGEPPPPPGDGKIRKSGSQATLPGINDNVRAQSGEGWTLKEEVGLELGVAQSPKYSIGRYTDKQTGERNKEGG